MLYYEDFVKGKKTLTEKQFQTSVQNCLQCYEHDSRFREMVDHILKYADELDVFKAFKTMVGFRSLDGDFLIDVEYPIAFNRDKITVYLAKLDYKEIDNKGRVKVKHDIAFGHPRINVETDSEVQYLKNLINYIILKICKSM